MGSADYRKTKRSLLFRLDDRGIRGTGGLFGGFPLDATELFCVRKNEVHVLKN